MIDVRLGHLAQELARKGREALDVPPLALGVQRVSNANELLPLPDTPVRQISWLRGNTKSTSRRLCSRAPLMMISEAGIRVGEECGARVGQIRANQTL